MSEPIEDSFEDFFEEPEPVKTKARPVKKKQSGGCLLNVLSGILVTGTMVVGLVFAIIFINPQSSLNPIPPTTIPALVLTNTPTPTPKGILPATWTPTNSPTPTATNTPIPTNTEMPTDTPIPTADLESGTTFKLQEGSPSYEINSNHLDAGCN